MNGKQSSLLNNKSADGGKLELIDQTISLPGGYLTYNDQYCRGSIGW